MMTRLVVSVVIFLASIGVILSVLLAAALTRIHGGRATGLAALSFSPAENLAIGLVLVPLGFLSYWLSGKLAKP